MEFNTATLDNGLTLIAETNEAAETVACGFFVRAGSRDETPAVHGVTHFLEHMIFKGTARRSVFDVNREFDEIGANYNASTSEENTVFYAAVLPEFQAPMLDLLCDILRPALRQEDFDIEKSVILEEIALFDDQPRFRVCEKLTLAFFDGHPLGQSVLGTKQSIGAMTRQDMLDYFQRRYAPGNITAVATGRLDWNAFVNQAAAMCSAWSGPPAGRETPFLRGQRTETFLTDERLLRQNTALMSPAPSYQDDARFAAQLLATVVGDSTGSRLFYSLVDPAIADEAEMSYNAMDGTGAFTTFLSTDPDRADEALRLVRSEFRRVLEDGLTAEELQSAKNKIASGATIRSEMPMGRLASVGSEWIYRREYVPLQRQIDTMFAVTAEQVMEVAAAYDITSTALLSLGPRHSI